MQDYDFLKRYIESTPDAHKGEYRLNRGINEEEIRLLQRNADLAIPNELREFYEFSYGALLNEYRILTIPEIIQTISRIRTIYVGTYKTSTIPFAYLVGVGDWIAFDTKKSNKDGLLIIDCFHEVPPDKWKGICFGLRIWLRKMVNNNFRPFWL